MTESERCYTTPSVDLERDDRFSILIGRMALDFAGLQSHCASKLETLLATPARASDDWAIALPGRCSCELCCELSRFLVAKSRTLEWPLAKDRRAHVHGILDGRDLPVTHTTRREGSPYTLVLAKTSALFEREAAERAA